MTDVVLFADQVWDTDVPTNRQQVAARLPNHLDCRVVYVESPSFAPSPILGLGRYDDGFHFVEGDRERVSLSTSRVTDDLWVVSPLLPVPHRHAKRVPSLVFGAVRRFVARAVDRLDVMNPLVWSHSPFGAAYLPDPLDPSGVVYDCVDRYDQLDYYADYGVDVEARQAETLDLADVVFVSSEPLYERFREGHPNVHLTGNAADIDLFRTARVGGEATPVPELRDVSGPILGFYGLLTGYKLDFELLRTLVRERPDATLVLVGPDDESLPEWIETAQNVRRFPRVPQREIPGYLTAFDVCLLPYKTTEYTAGIEPLKLYEYLAAEKPVVATAFVDLPDCREWLRMAGSDEEFLKLVDGAIDDPPDMFDVSLDDHDWGAKIGRMLDAVREAELLGQNAAH